MDFTVWVLHADGRAEDVSGAVDAERAEAIARHPSMSGAVVVVVPTFVGMPTG